MRLRSFLIALAVLIPCAAGAQTATVDGIQALIRGDYASAAHILRPLAEEALEPDPLAQFFMATMYEWGRGVPINQTRACGLYLNAAKPSNPFMSQSLALAENIHDHYGLLRDQCFAVSLYGWREPPAASFSLAPDHRVRVDRTGFTVVYKGVEKKALVTPLDTPQMASGGAGWTYLPFRPTQLDVSRPIEARRNFIEFFIWMPYNVGDQSTWVLAWWVHEVVGLEMRAVSVPHTLTTIVAARPPTSFAAGDLAGLRLNTDGEAEWVVFGPNPRADIIPYMESR